MKSHKPGFATRLAIVISALLLAANMLLGIVLMNNSKTAIKTLIDNRMLDISNTAADMLDGDVLGRLEADDKDTPEYRLINDTLAVFQENIDLKYIYCIRDNGNDNFTFTVDPTIEDPGVFGEPIVSTEALRTAAKGTPSVDMEPYSDAWGNFYSAYSPVFDSAGNVAGIVAVDFSADWYNQQISKQSHAIMIGSALSVALGIICVFVATARLRKQMRIMVDELDGKSILGSLLEGEKTPNDCIFWEMEDQTAVRRGKYKLVINGRLTEGETPRAPVFLSDLEADPGEKHNLADEMPELCKELTELALKWREGIERKWDSEFAKNYSTT